MTEGRPGPRTAFHSTSTAPSWDLGMVVGSGAVGAVIYGDPTEHHVSLAHERYFLPANSRTPPPMLAPSMASARAALATGDAPAAAEIIDSAVRAAGFDDLIWTDPLAPCSVITWRPDGDPVTTGYRRDLDFVAGVATVSWPAGDGRTELRIKSPRGTDRVEVAIIAGPVPLTGELVLTTPSESRASGDNVGAVAYIGGVELSTSTNAFGGDLVALAAGAEPQTAAVASTILRFDDTTVIDGAPRATDDSISWRLALPAGSVTRITLNVTIAKQDAPATTAPTAVGSHADLVTASSLSLASDTDPGLSTEELWTAARMGDDDALRGVIELTYAAGRYNTISSTGVLPPTLQGVWQGTWTPAWSADYTMNGNVQNGGAAALIPTGTPELALSLFRLVEQFREDFRINASHIFGVEGAMLPARMTTHGMANHFNADYPHELWIGNGGWLLRFLEDTIRATGDRTILTDELWEFTVEILTFYAQLLDPTVGDPWLWPSFSPENTPDGASTPITSGTTMDLAVIRDAARVGLFLSAVRGDERHVGRWSALIETDPPYRVAADGTLAEWLSPDYAENLAHRHVSQLYPLWYDIDPAFARDDHLRDAARRTIEAKIAWRKVDPTPPPGRMEMAFGLVQLGLGAATLGLADSALQCVEWLSRDHWTPAMVSTHDAGRIFNLDASGGLPAVIAAMLLGSRDNELSPLQALPDSWANGEVTGLRARNGLIVERLAWTAQGCDLHVVPTPDSSWLRRDETVIVLPRDAVSSHRDVRSVDGTTFVVDVPVEGVKLSFTWT